MKSYWSLILVLMISFSFAQDAEKEDEIKPFKKSSNKYYIGASVSPVIVGLLNGDNYEPEWKILYKQRLAKQNHYMRVSYSFLNSNQQYYLYTQSYDFYDGRRTYALNDSMDWVTGQYKNVSTNHVIKLGYEYQFKVGAKRNVSVNLGGDLLLGVNGGKTYYANDTITYKNETVDGWIYRSIVDYKYNSLMVQRAQLFYGVSPFVALGVPLKKRFDLTFEMAFDCRGSAASLNYQNIGAFEVDYRPSIMLSYRFDEDAVRSKSRGKGKER